MEKKCSEFSKRLDKDVGFYYHTSSHHRYFEGDRPDFSKPSDRPRDLYIAQRELMAGKWGWRVSLVKSWATSIHAPFHNVPVELPPTPSLPSHVSDLSINYKIMSHDYFFANYYLELWPQITVWDLCPELVMLNPTYHPTDLHCG